MNTLETMNEYSLIYSRNREYYSVTTTIHYLVIYQMAKIYQLAEE